MSKKSWHFDKHCFFCKKPVEKIISTNQEYKEFIQELLDSGWVYLDGSREPRAYTPWFCSQECYDTWHQQDEARAKIHKAEDELYNKLRESIEEHVMTEFAYQYTNIDPLIETDKLPIKLKYALRWPQEQVEASFKRLWQHARENFIEGSWRFWHDDYGIKKTDLRKRLNRMKWVINFELTSMLFCSESELIL